MKPIKDYQRSAAISLHPFPSRYCNVLRVEINPEEFKKEDYKNTFDELLKKFRVNYSVSDSKSFGNGTEYKNVIEFTLAYYVNEVELAKDITEELKKMFDSVLNRVRIKKEYKKNE